MVPGSSPGRPIMIILKKLITYHVKEAALCIDDDWEKAGQHMKIVYHLVMINKIDKEIRGIK